MKKYLKISLGDRDFSNDIFEVANAIRGWLEDWVVYSNDNESIITERIRKPLIKLLVGFHSLEERYEGYDVDYLKYEKYFEDCLNIEFVNEKVYNNGENVYIKLSDIISYEDITLN